MKGISHITLLCKDIEKSSQFFCDLLDGKEVYSSDQHNFSLSKEKFLLLGDLWLALMEGNPIERSYNHIAFHVLEEDLPKYHLKIQKYGLEILPGRPRNNREGKSIYFYDFDNHLLELHTGELSSRLKYYEEALSN